MYICRYQGIQPTARIKAEPIETHENESSGDSDRDGDADGADGDGDGDGDGTRHLRLPSTPKTPYSTPRSRLSATDIQRTTPRKDLDKMLVKDLRCASCSFLSLLYLFRPSFPPL